MIQVRIILASAFAAAALILCSFSPGLALQVKAAGKLTIPAGARVMPFSTDPVMQRVLSQDLAAAGRAPGASAQQAVTLTVSVREDQLKPGVSLGDIAPGDPQVAALIAAAGATPPPIGDTGDEIDEGARARHLQQSNLGPTDSPMEEALNQNSAPDGMMPPISEGGMPPSGPPGQSSTTGDTQAYLQQGRAQQQFAHFYHHDTGQYDTVVVARATLSGSSNEMTVVGVALPGEDTRALKQIVAETIAGALLH
ncbi:MAG: hypothetical protein ACREQ4_13375 [Candidatus Binataceae bacterium]